MKTVVKSEGGYILNRDMGLTPEAEIRWLKAVIAEKNKVIDEFKKYDNKRKSYYSRFEQNYAMMEEQFNHFLDCVRDEEGWGTAQMVQHALRSDSEREKAFRERKERAERCIQSLHDIGQSLPTIEKGLRDILDFAEAHDINMGNTIVEKIGSLLLKIVRLQARVEASKEQPTK